MAKVIGIQKESRSFKANDGGNISGRGVSVSFVDEKYDGMRVAETFCTDEKMTQFGVKVGAEVPIYYRDKKWKIGESRTY